MQNILIYENNKLTYIASGFKGLYYFIEQVILPDEAIEEICINEEEDFDNLTIKEFNELKTSIRTAETLDLYTKVQTARIYKYQGYVLSIGNGKETE